MQLFLVFNSFQIITQKIASIPIFDSDIPFPFPPASSIVGLIYQFTLFTRLDHFLGTLGQAKLAIFTALPALFLFPWVGEWLEGAAVFWAIVGLMSILRITTVGGYTTLNVSIWIIAFFFFLRF